MPVHRLAAGGCSLLTAVPEAVALVLGEWPEEGDDVVCVSGEYPLCGSLALQVFIPGFRRRSESSRHQVLQIIFQGLTLMAYALERGRLSQHLEAREQQVQALLRSAVEAQEAERERVSLEVHDGVAQTLVSVFQLVQTIEGILPADSPGRELAVRASSLLHQAIQEAREVIRGLRPPILSQSGLVPALTEEARRLREVYGLAVELHAEPLRLSPEIEAGVYRILREALNNARRHSQASRVSLTLSRQGDDLVAVVRDEGRGFDPASLAAARQRGTGLFSMNRRAELLGGHCYIESQPGLGTTVTLVVPLTGGGGQQPHL